MRATLILMNDRTVLTKQCCNVSISGEYNETNKTIFVVVCIRNFDIWLMEYACAQCVWREILSVYEVAHG